MTTQTHEYQIAFAGENGTWDVVETFQARDNAAAERYAERYCRRNHSDRVDDWYVLRDGKNIND